MTNILDKTDNFDEWLNDLNDIEGKQAINVRIERAEGGNFGDCRWNIKEGVSEMRIDIGPGYRLYFCQRGKNFYLLLVGGTKSQQQRDIDQAVEYIAVQLFIVELLYLQRYALNNQKANSSQTYIVCADSKIAGYYSLSVAGVDYTDAPERIAKGLAKHPVPVMLLARLAVDIRFQRQGLGTAL